MERGKREGRREGRGKEEGGRRRGSGREEEEEGGERVQQMNSWHRLTKAKQYLYVFTISSIKTLEYLRGGNRVT